MQTLNPKFKLDDFYDKLLRSNDRLLFLDYDGTIAPFNINPRNAFPYPGVIETILGIKNTRIIIVSGRALKDLIPLIPLEGKVEFWGSHGSERLTIEGEYCLKELSRDETLMLNEGWIKVQDMLSNLIIEKKPTSIALHWRGQSEKDIEEIKNQIIELWTPITEKKELFSLHFFNGGIELRPRWLTKGIVVTTLLEECNRDTLIAYLGDDITDEEAFLRLKERGLKILVSNQTRETLADIQISAPTDLLDFLNHWKEDVRS